MSDIVIGLSKSARAGYSFDDVAVAPHRRTRDPEAVDLTWQIDAYNFDMPIIAAPMDSIVSPATAIAMGRLGGLGVLNLEGLVDPVRGPRPRRSQQIRTTEPRDAVPVLQELYQARSSPS